MNYKEIFNQIFNIIFIPTNFKPLKFILIMENLLTVYRNVAYYEIKSRFMIYFRILIEIVASILGMAVYSLYILPVASNNDLIFYYTSIFNSLITMLLASYYSKKFNKLVLLFENNHTHFSNDFKYQANMKKLGGVIKWVIIIFIFMVVMSGFIWSYVRNKLINPVTLNILFTLNSRTCDCRNVFEYIAVYSVLYVISQQLECITRAVRNKRNKRIVSEQKNNISNENFSEIRRETRDFEELYTVFSNIAECSKLINQIYGLQLVLMLGWATIYCIMFLYTMAFLSIKGSHDLSMILGSVWRLFVFLLLLLLLSQSAQKNQNGARDLRRELATLLISYVDTDAEYKATKDFLCLVSTRSIQTKTCGSIRVDLTLIPSIVMFITSYTVIALQFSNIV